MKRLSLLLAAVLLLSGCGAQTRSDPPAPTLPVPGAPLTVEEYPIVADAEDKPSHFEFRDRIGQDVLAKRAQWRQGPTLAERAEVENQVLKRFGYELVVQGEAADLRKDGQVIATGLVAFSQATESPGVKDFLLVARTGVHQFVIVRNDRVETWSGQQMSDHFFMPPVLVGNDLVAVESRTTLLPPSERIAVRKGNRVVYTAETAGPSPELPIKGLHAWNGHWVLELKGEVIIDGNSLNEEKGYDEVFNWRLIDGRPFYFFRQGERIGIFYDGQVLEQEYQQVQHYLCCEPAAFNPGGNASMIWFHALRDGVWHYVEAGVYQ